MCGRFLLDCLDPKVCRITARWVVSRGLDHSVKYFGVRDSLLGLQFFLRHCYVATQHAIMWDTLSGHDVGSSCHSISSPHSDFGF